MGRVITFLLTDVEGSTRLWDADPDAMAAALARHDEIVESAVTAMRGTFVKARGEGDSTFSVFTEASDALAAALRVRDQLERAPWPAAPRLVVRSAVHTGDAIARDGDYYGPTVNRAARIRALAVGGQILVSSSTAELVRDGLPRTGELVDLGRYELRGLSEPEQVFAVAEPGTPSRAITPGVCPYQGLLAFQPEDRDRFCGRDELVAKLHERLVSRGVLAVVGASGSGKSSLVRAGIVPAMGAALEPVIMSPGAKPLDELAERVAAVRVVDPSSTRRQLTADPAAVLAPATGAHRSLLLVVDQLEELFTECSDVAERQAFLDVLVTAGSDPTAMLLVALRADRYGECAQHPRFAAMISSANELLGPIRPEELQTALEQPARQSGLQLESGLLDAVLRDVAGEPGALPLVSHALRETWRRREGNVLTLAGYRAADGVRGAIARTADNIYESLTPDRQRTMRGMFLRLTEIGDGTEDTRRQAPIRELVGPDRTQGTDVLEVLTDARLVTIGTTTVEVAHEALIREWPRLRGWLDDDREGLRLLRELARAADEWAALDRDAGALYRGARLAAVLQWLAGDPSLELSVLEREFVDASRGAQEQEVELAAARLREQTRANRRLRRLLIGVGIALVLAVAAGVLAVVQRTRADDQTHRAQAATQRAEVGRLVADSHALLTGDRSLSAALAVAASRLADTAATRGALADVLTTDPRLRTTLTGRSRSYSNVAYSPDGAQLIVRARDALDVFDTRTARLSAHVKLPTPGAGLAISPDGKLLATGGIDGQVRFLDRTSRHLVGTSLHVGANVIGVAFSHDGTTLAVAAGTYGDPSPVPTERTVQLWDVTTRRLLPVRLSGHTGSVNTVAFSPDGRLLATGGNDHLVVLHDPHTGATVGPPLTVDSQVYSLAFPPDGNRIAVGDQSSRVSVFDLGTRAQLGAPLAAQGILNAVAFSPDGATLVTSGAKAIVWDASTLAPIGSPIETQTGTDVAFRPDGRAFAVAGFTNVTVWDPGALPLFSRSVIGAPPFGGRFSPDGKTLALPRENAVTLYDARTLRPLGPPLQVASGPTLGLGIQIPATVAFTRDGARVAVAGLGSTVQVFDVATRHAIGPTVVLESPAWSLAFSPNGSLLAIGGTQHDVYLVDSATGQRRGPLQPEPPNLVFSVSFSPDGRRLLATSSINEAVVYDRLQRAAPPGRFVAALRGQAIAAAYSPTGSLLATAGADGSLQFRRAQTFAPRGPRIAANASAVNAVVFSPDGRLVATADGSFASRLVDVRTSQPIGAALPAGGLSTPSFRPNGREIVLSAPGGTLLVTLDLAAWRADACRLAGRNLTPAEQREYFGTPHRVTACPGAPTPS